MNKIILVLTFISIAILLIACSQNPQAVKSDYDVKKAETRIANVTNELGDTLKKIVKSDAEWREELTADEFYVLRKAGTERPFTGDLLKNKKEGIYTCAACALPLFDSSTKFESGTGWPSFYQPIVKANVGVGSDTKLGYSRDEVHCARCGGHQGHVFNDGPKPTGLRYCINAVALDFVEREQ